MATVRIWVHLVWTTKKREPCLSKDIREKIFGHIKGNAKFKNIHIDFINGYKDHIHTLISMKANQSVSNIAHLIKGESSYWVNKNNLVKGRFSWQEEFYAASVSYSNVDQVRNYIKNQEKHHKEITFEDEYKSFLVEMGLDKKIHMG